MLEKIVYAHLKPDVYLSRFIYLILEPMENVESNWQSATQCY